MKVCRKCDEIKPFSEFSKYSKSKDGYQIWCKTCHNAQNKKNAEDRLKNGHPIVRTYKTCTICKDTKPISQFYIKRGYSADGYGPSCKLCWARKCREVRKKRGI